MDKFSGKIGFVSNEEIEPGIWEDIVTEKPYRGEIRKNHQNFNVTDTTSGEIKITNLFSIMGNSYAFAHVSDIRYLVWRGNRWLIDTIELRYPRLEITLKGGLYNGPQVTTTDDPASD